MTRLRGESRRLHFLGIGGCGMSGLALVCLELGAEVSGSDRVDGPFIERLRQRGIQVSIGDSPDHVPEATEIVYSSAVKEESPERRRAHDLGMSQINRGELLSELAHHRPTIVVAGTHGKTTTSAMIAHCLMQSDPSVGYIIGGDLLSTDLNARWGDDNSWLVIESDESDKSVLGLSADIGVLTSVDHDHVVTFPTLRDVQNLFSEFLAHSQTVVVSDTASSGLPVSPAESFTEAPARPSAVGSTFTWRHEPVFVPQLGLHNALNAQTALEACLAAGVSAAKAAAAMSTYPGVARRLEPVGRHMSGARVYLDYAHHPTEVAAALAAVGVLDSSRVAAVYEPWGFRRTRALTPQSGRALSVADRVYVLPHAGSVDDETFPGEGTRLIADAVATASHGVVETPEDYSAAQRRLDSDLKPDDVCPVMGCGPVFRLAESLVTSYRSGN